MTNATEDYNTFVRANLHVLAKALCLPIYKLNITEEQAKKLLLEELVKRRGLSG